MLPATTRVQVKRPGGMMAVDIATGDRSVFLAPLVEDPQPCESVASASFLDTEFSRLIANRAGSTWCRAIA